MLDAERLDQDLTVVEYRRTDEVTPALERYPLLLVQVVHDLDLCLWEPCRYRLRRLLIGVRYLRINERAVDPDGDVVYVGHIAGRTD